LFSSAFFVANNGFTVVLSTFELEINLFLYLYLYLNERAFWDYAFLVNCFDFKLDSFDALVEQLLVNLLNLIVVVFVFVLLLTNGSFSIIQLSAEKICSISASKSTMAIFLQSDLYC